MVVEAEAEKDIIWSDFPYVDADNHGLVMTCSEAVPSPDYGTWVIATDVSTTTINENFIGKSLGENAYAVLINKDWDVISRPGQSVGNLTWNEPFNKENAFSGNASDLRMLRDKYDCRNDRQSEQSCSTARRCMLPTHLSDC